MTTDSIPKRLGKYEIIGEIGRGGFAAVYEAVDTTLDRTVALKALAPHLLWDPSFLERFQQEAKLAANLKHPNIVVIYEAGTLEGVVYITMEHLGDQSLAELVREEGALAPSRILKITSQVASALDYAHSKGVVHRDVKPSNIMIGAGDHITVTDFGIAKAAAATAMTTMGKIFGTPEYMSPEQARGERDLDARSDNYSLGVVTYRMFTGQAPFSGETPLGVMRCHADEPPPPPSQINPAIPPAVEAVLLKALAKEREKRYQRAGDMALAMEEALSGEVEAAERAEARAREERAKQEQIATLYEQALGLARARQWRQALAKMEEIQTLDPQFADPERIAARAREAVNRENELAALYAEAVRLLRARQYQEALEKWGEVQARDPRYPDRQNVQAKARKKLAEATPPKRGLPRWVVAAIGGLALVAIVVVVVLLRREFGERAIAWSNAMPCQSVTSEAAEIESPWLRNKVTLDGKMTMVQEWSDAVCLDLTLLEKIKGPAMISSRWWVKNDAQWLYLLARVPVAELEAYEAWIGYFWPYPYVGRWEHSDGGSVDQGDGTSDNYGWDEERWYEDILASPPGENNVEGGASKGATYYWFEFRKALNSGDGYDWSWASGEIVGDEGDLLLGISDETVPTWFNVYILLHLGSP